MAKDPAFLFYVGDWLGGTTTFTRPHKGAYMDILMAQFNQGHLSIDDIKIILGADFEAMWESKLISKFKVDENGLFYNQKLEYEIIRRREYTKSRRDNLSKSMYDKSSHIKPHMVSHMENETDNVIKPKKKKERKIFIPPSIDEVIAYFKEKGFTESAAKKAHDYYSVADWHDAKGDKVNNWKQKMQAVWFKEENKQVAQIGRDRYMQSFDPRFPQK